MDAHEHENLDCLTEQVLGAVFEVSNTLGAGFLEKVYQRALLTELWREHWERVIPFFAFPEEVRKIVYTTNAVESLHMSLRKIIKTRGSFPTEEAAFKLLYLSRPKRLKVKTLPGRQNRVYTNPLTPPRDELRSLSLRPNTRKQITPRTVYTDSLTPPRPSTAPFRKTPLGNYLTRRLKILWTTAETPDER